MNLENNKYKTAQTTILSKETLEFITGMLLGDGNISLKQQAKNARMHFTQKSEDFITLIYNVMKDNGLVKANFKKYNHLDKRTNKVNTSFKFGSLSNIYLTEIYHQWYAKVGGVNKKILPLNISELLTPRAFAFWIMGDGCFDKQGGTIILATNNFNLIEVTTLQTILKSKFDITTTISKSGNNQFRMVIPRREVVKVIELVQNYFIISMLYKLGL